MKRTLVVIISPTGETKLETRGFVGASCREASAFLEQALGAKTDERLTAEFYQSTSMTQVQQEGHA